MIQKFKHIKNDLAFVFVIDMMFAMGGMFLFYIHEEEYWFMLLAVIFIMMFMAWVRWSLHWAREKVVE